MKTKNWKLLGKEKIELKRLLTRSSKVDRYDQDNLPLKSLLKDPRG